MKVVFKKEKETKNTIRYEEQPEPGKPPVIGSLYVQRWFACDRETIEIEIPEAEVDDQYHLGHQGLPCCMMPSSVTFQLSSTGPGTRQGARAGFNGDGNINVLDALGIVNVILGIGSCVP